MFTRVKNYYYGYLLYYFRLNMLSSNSGAAKRRKQKEIAESNSKLPKITNFLVVQNLNNPYKIPENIINFDVTSINSVKKSTNKYT